MENKCIIEKLQLIIPQTMDGWTVERVLRREVGVSRTLLRRAKRNRVILLNQLPVKTNVTVKTGEVLELWMGSQETQVVPERMELNILYEDAHLLAVNKPPGMLVHPLTNETSGTLANGVLYHWLQQGTIDRFRPVHRLDRNTSGIVLIARNPYVQQQLQIQMKQGQFVRRYLALVKGKVQPEQGVIQAPIALEEGSFIKRMISPAGKEAISHYQVLRTFNQASLVRVELETGRTHQVRVHMAHMGHPLLGDSLYGGDTSNIKRQALHCAYLAFNHPVQGSRIKISCSVAGDIRQLMEEHSKKA
ncbi:pseudouridine synthase, RluA family [Desulforamulus reducens MI-1]|uniref:Pseudouridine synthase n=1 Tax=Desulforamulus reducens (strain ATCC BAA-1160 / DSM 100696 / MI-1) TaxID=349161 RepID=A4J479_DESRM|nr:RluA family pseudouridine synthase [Desulforamulus reducens]ABO49882.1 pseudouridine synthase, RluA family [Desulforamulus reducens MI-1]